jgi:hypothetical protein
VDDDVISASIVGNTISAYKNGTLMMQATDKTYTSGAPGMGVNFNSGCTHYGFKDFSASDSQCLCRTGMFSNERQRSVFLIAQRSALQSTNPATAHLPTDGQEITHARLLVLVNCSRRSSKRCLAPDYKNSQCPIDECCARLEQIA